MIKNSLKTALFLLAAVILGSCSEKRLLDKAAFLNYFNKGADQFFKEKELNNVSYKVKLVPPELITLNNNRSINSEEEYKKELRENEDRINFVMIVEDMPGSNLVKELVFKKEMYSKLVEYANVELAKDFQLIKDTDTIPCSLIHLEPANSVHPVIRMTACFDNPKKGDKDYTLVFDDNFFSNGNLKFNFPEETFTDLPTLKF
jgi:hypothetical protein